MTKSHTQKFLARFPGPYRYHLGRNGVDDTFDIVCESTEREIASYHYWDHSILGELRTHVITEALNERFPHPKKDAFEQRRHLSPDELIAFRSLHPGPYATDALTCPMYGKGYEILCRTTRSTVYTVFAINARTVARQIAEALQALTTST